MIDEQLVGFPTNCCIFVTVNTVMKIHSLLNDSCANFTLLSQQCSQFFEQSNDLPIYKSIKIPHNFKKIKVRRKKSSKFDQTFNGAFTHHPNLRERCIAVSGNPPTISNQTFYVFPIDGYKFMYNHQVIDSLVEYQPVFDSLVNTKQDIVPDMLNLSYIHEQLHNGIQKGTEILIYNIPYYFAVKTNIEYDQLLNNIHNA